MKGCSGLWLLRSIGASSTGGAWYNYQHYDVSCFVTTPASKINLSRHYGPGKGDYVSLGRLIWLLGIMLVKLVLLGIMLQPLLVLLRLLEMLLGMTLELVLMGMPGSGLPHSICITVFQLFASRNYIYKA